MTSSTRRIDPTAIDELLTSAVEGGDVPHVVAVVADRDGVLYEGAAGPRDAGEGAGDQVGSDTLFAIMSMTKMICTTAALQQVERGDLDLDAPVDSYCPEFAEVQVLDGWDGEDPRLRAPASRVTVRHLVTHTSGLGYWFYSDDLVRYESATGTPNLGSGRVEGFGSPLVHDPGERFTYGIGSDWLGRVVEAVAGVGLDRVLAESVTGPLDMTDTMFVLDEARAVRSAPVHVPGPDGGWTAAGRALSREPEWCSGGHGLYSTAGDYLRFQRALLRGGELDGVRILREETVDAVFDGQLGGLGFPESMPSADPGTAGDLSLGPGWTWGLGLLLNQVDLPGGRRAGTGSWSGLLNTHYLVDRRSGVCAAIYTSCLPFLAPGAWATYQGFERALYAALR